MTVLIPNKDHVQDLHRCLAALYRNSGWRNMEVVIIENNSTEQETFDFYQKITHALSDLRVIRYEGAFNFSAINNFGAQHANGEYLLLLNNDVEMTTPDFLREMLSYAQRADVGAEGAKLIYPDRTVQHDGVFVGLGGSAGG